MSIVTYPAIDDVEFSADDRAFLADQAGKRDMMTALVTLIAGASTAVNLLSTNIKSGGDLGEYLVDRSVDIATDNWVDATEAILKIEYSLALEDVQWHLLGKYRLNSRKLTAPIGQAKKFFNQLKQYYIDLRAEL